MDDPLVRRFQCRRAAMPEAHSAKADGLPSFLTALVHHACTYPPFVPMRSCLMSDHRYFRVFSVEVLHEPPDDALGVRCPGHHVHQPVRLLPLFRPFRLF